MHPQALDFVDYFRTHSQYMPIRISTNGSARTKQFWQDLAKLKPRVSFCLDGLEDTHSLYRIDTNYERILENADAYIKAGGLAVWKMILFDHNQHQVEACKNLAKKLGFISFELVDHKRNTGLVFDRNGSYSHSIGKPKVITDNANAFYKLASKQQHVEPTHYDTFIKPKCAAQSSSMIYISAEGKVYPCCWTGLSPENYTYGYVGYTNKQIAQLIENNSLYDYDLNTCLLWTKKVEQAFEKTSYAEGRLVRCDSCCGTSNNK